MGSRPPPSDPNLHLGGVPRCCLPAVARSPPQAPPPPPTCNVNPPHTIPSSVWHRRRPGARLHTVANT
eukprot:4558473-Pyramimonas_sp.AAC.1